MNVSPQMTGIKRFGIWFSDVEMSSRTSLLRAFEETEWNWCSYDPGDVAVVHPKASPVDVDSFLTTMNWSNVADEPIRLQHVFEGLFTCINEAISTRRLSQIKVSRTIFLEFQHFVPSSRHISTSTLSQRGPSFGF
jgi:sulfite reductase alpha subunit-like flavoprotein